jgi:tetratricopeptide (TPR) repeat protein
MKQGDLVAGRFRVDMIAGEGGMGTVYHAHDELTSQEVALKILFPERVSDLSRFSREATLLRELKHPSIVAYIAHGTIPGGPSFLVMEWARGKTLHEELTTGRLGAPSSLKIAHAILRALGSAHRRGVIHRDIKPRNIMVAPDGLVKVLDFGIARARTESTALTRTGVFLGTPGYIAPEQARGERDVDGRADIFSTGCVLFECLTGRPAFVAKDVVALLAKLVIEEVPLPSELAPEIPASVDALVGRMLAKDQTERAGDADVLANEIEEILSSFESSATWNEVAPRRLTESELKLFSVVLSTGEGEDTLVSAPGNKRVRSAATLTEELSSIGVRPERLADGSVVCTIAGAGIATDIAARAARCALVLRRHLADRPVVVGTGRGVFSGPLPAGEVIDRTVLMLRRLEASASASVDPSWIPIDPLTAGLLDSTFDVRGVGEDLFLVGERGPLDARRRLLGREAPFVGRDRDLAFLESCYIESCDERTAAAVVVIGAAGMGKTRLIFELMKRIEACHRRPTILIARADALGAQSPFSMVAQLVRRAADIHDDEPLETKRLKLGARVLRYVPPDQAERVADFLGELTSIRTSLDERPRLRAARHDPMLMREEIERAWSDFVAAECQEHPLFIVLEDLQWGDLPSVKLLEHALHEHRDRPLFVLAAGRPGVETLFPSLWEELGVQELRLAKLSRAACRSFVRDMMDRTMPDARIDAIVARADGNAFYLEELIRAVHDASSDDLPETLVAMVNDRLHALDADARRVLRAASVFGETFWAEGLRSLLGDSGSSAALTHWIEILLREELIDHHKRSRFVGHEEYAFRHALLREAAYASLVPDDRAGAHRAAALWLTEAGECDSVLLAEHFERSGEPSRAVDLYRRAAEQALDGHDLEGASTRAARGIAGGAGGEQLARLLIVQGEVHALRGENLEAEKCGTEVLSLVPRGSAPWCWAAGATLVLRTQLGEAEGAQAIAEELSSIEFSEGDAAVALVRASARAMPFVCYGGYYETAKRLLKAARRSLGAIDPSATAAAGWMELASAEAAAWAEEDAQFALESARAAGACFRAVRSDLAAAIASITIGAAQIELGDADGAFVELNSAVAVADKLGAKLYGALARMFAGTAALAKGELGTAHQLLETAVDAFYRQGNIVYFGMSRMSLARVLLAMGDLEGAEREASESLLAFSATPSLRTIGLGVLGQVQLARGAHAEALVTFEDSYRALLTLGGVASGDAAIRTGYADALRSAGKHEEAHAIDETAREHFERRSRLSALNHTKTL